jgi:hypothetical protein
LLVNNIDDDEKIHKSERERFNDLPASEIIILNRKLPTEIQPPDLTSKLCDDSGNCFGHLNFNYDNKTILKIFK